jgi:prepilin-type N-terminal cleavage/methylation domain-containing protein/prepilin-type processing-associated H-X9-DG protein
MMMRRKGFTLIELLVVIAIIGILAAMLFPVFARAREAARKIQCLANVKNIAMAVQMYLVDWDRFFPKLHDQAARDYIVSISCGGCDTAADCFGTLANPYLKHPVILDEYIKNRDVWKCASARHQKQFAINFGYGRGDWFQALQDSGGTDGLVAPCWEPFPPGWGGDITDSVAQDSLATGPNAFVQQIGVPWTLDEMSTSAIVDPSKTVACADAGVVLNQLDRTSWVAYPDVCMIDSNACNDTCGCDWANCADGQSCGGPLAIEHGGDGKMAMDAQYRKDHAKSRHLGGSNLGFCDGHAKWMASEAILFGGENWSGYATSDPPLLYGLGVCICPEKTNRYH